jgi:endo-1,4-beta-xylanase
LSRRSLLASAFALAACKGEAQTPAPTTIDLPPLKSIARFPLGACAMAGELDDPVFRNLLTSHFSQITPEWEMKMERILKDDGGFDFSAADAIAAFAGAHGLRLHGHTLIWYNQAGPAFQRIDGQGPAFAAAYRNYILAVAGRYRGRASGWDVVNEPVSEEGDGYRDCLWRKNLGMDYVATAFRHAREADPGAVLFLNDYNLEAKPAKRRRFLALAEAVLKTGAPLGGLGSQTHLDTDVSPQALKAAIRDLASLGLPIHISELDVSVRRGGRDRYERQATLYGAAAEALAALPASQRYALTVWGVRDQDSWLRRPPNAGDGSDQPLLFDLAGRPKPAAAALAKALQE